MAMSDEIKQETKKMKDMSFKDKLSYIWDYYKYWIIGGIVLIVFLTLFIRDWTKNNRPVYLHTIFVNSNFAVDSTDSTIEADYIAYDGVDTDKYNLYFDLSILIDGEGYDQLALANQQKIMALYSSAELDSVIGPEDFIETYTDINAYADLDALLPDDLKQELLDKGYEFYYYSYDNKPQAIGIYMDNCTYLNNQGSNGTFPDINKPEKRPIFTIAVNTQNTEHAISLLRMLIQ